MDEWTLILLAVLPSAIVFLTAFYILKRFIDRENRKMMLELRMEAKNQVLPLRLQAYERISLYLERIHPNTLVMRVHKGGMSARLMQSELLKTIRSEYDHNVTQQVYVSPSLWQAVRASKEETLKIVNIAASKVSDEASGLDLTKKVMELSAQLEKIPSDFAMEVLKAEIRKLF